MDKSTAIKLLGGTVASAASRVGVTVQAVNQWPDPLPARIADRVMAALAREHLPPEVLAQLDGQAAAPPETPPRSAEPEHSQATAYARRADDTVRALEHACGITSERRRDDRRKVERRHAEGDGHAR